MRTLKFVSRIGLTIGAVLAGALPAAAQTYPPPSEVAPTVVTQGGGQAPAAAAGGGLAFTGAEIGLLLLAVAFLVAVGAFALIMARRRSAQAA
jgi:hypothetical protein